MPFLPLNKYSHLHIREIYSLLIQKVYICVIQDFMYFNVKFVEFSALHFTARQNNQTVLIFNLKVIFFAFQKCKHICKRSAGRFSEKNDIPKARHMQRLVVARSAYKNCAEGNCKIPAGFRSHPMIEILTARCHRAIILVENDLKKKGNLYHRNSYGKRATFVTLQLYTYSY